MTSSLIIVVIAQFMTVLSHNRLNFTIVNTRTCPHTSDMEQRIAMLMEAIYWKTTENQFVFGGRWGQFGSISFNELLENVIFNGGEPDEIAIAFPNSIEKSAPYFLYPEFLQIGIDHSNHIVWYSLTFALNGGVQPDRMPGDEEFGLSATISFDQYLASLPYTIQIIPGNSWYWCDEVHAWGFGYGTVFIREKKTGREYIGRAEIDTTFANIKNQFGNDEWLMEEFGIYWDIFSDSASCGNDCENVHSSDDALSIGNNIMNDGNNGKFNDGNHTIQLTLDNSILLYIFDMVLLCVNIIGNVIVYYCIFKSKSEVTFNDVPSNTIRQNL